MCAGRSREKRPDGGIHDVALLCVAPLPSKRVRLLASRPSSVAAKSGPSAVGTRLSSSWSSRSFMSANLPQEAVTLICAIVHQESSAWIIQSLPKGYSLLIQQACCCLFSKWSTKRARSLTADHSLFDCVYGRGDAVLQL